MQIRVKCGCGDGKCLEWAIIELQGVVESQSTGASQINGLEIGRLCCSSSSSQTNYTFTVGYHELSGTRVQLKKPLLVLQKKVATGAAMLPQFSDSPPVELEVIGIIRQKILFKNRPKALTSKGTTFRSFTIAEDDNGWRSEVFYCKINPDLFDRNQRN